MSRERVAAIVLAAGSSTRFGSTKQLAHLAGRPLVRATIESLAHAALDEVVVVVGHDARRVEAALQGLPLRVVVNEDHRAGMGGSIAVGIGSLRPTTHAAIVALGDQPLPAGVLERLIDTWRDGGAAIVVPSYRGTRGNPVLFDASMFPDLRALRREPGARGLIASAEHLVAVVELDRELPIDVDTPADLESLEES